MADPPKHKYRTRASMNQNVGNGNIVYNAEIQELQYPSKWLSQTVATKLPYYPQIGDIVVYFYQGHEIYLKAVKEHYNYVSSLPQLSLKAHHYCKVTGMEFKYVPPQICCLKLSILDDDGHLTGEAFTVKYHHLSQLHDFIVLRQVFDEALEQKFLIGMRVSSFKNQNGALERLIGTIESIEPIDMKFPTSHFMCCRVQWDNGNSDTLSPWEFQPLDNQNLPSLPRGMAPVIARDIRQFLYQPEPDEWPLQLDQDLVCDRMIKYLDQLIYMVDIDIYPDYRKVAYPVTLFIIRARLENKFYRRIDALKFDLRYLQINVEMFNEPDSQIVKQATILTDICLDIVKDIDKEIDIKGLYDKALSRSYVTSDSDMEVESMQAIRKPIVSTAGSSPKKRSNDDRQIGVFASIPSTSLRISPERQPIRNTAVFPKNVIGDWKNECKHLLKVIWNDKDSIPFRNPVDPIDFPDYQHIVPIQMCLQWVRNSLEHGEYTNPKKFEKEMKMIFSNSRKYNQNKHTEIYKMTTRLSYLFESYMESIFARWTKRNDKQKEKSVKGAKNAKKPMMDVEEDSSSSDNDEDDRNSDSDYIPETQSTVESEDLSQITEDLSQISTNSVDLVANVTNFNDAEDVNENNWEEGWTQALAQNPVLDQNYYKNN